MTENADKPTGLDSFTFPEEHPLFEKIEQISKDLGIDLSDMERFPEILTALENDQVADARLVFLLAVLLEQMTGFHQANEADETSVQN